MSNVIEAQCFGCVDSLSYMYHGASYDSAKKSREYVEEYQRQGQPIISCMTCGTHVKYVPTDDGKWQQVRVKEAE